MENSQGLAEAALDGRGLAAFDLLESGWLLSAIAAVPQPAMTEASPVSYRRAKPELSWGGRGGRSIGEGLADWGREGGGGGMGG